MMILKSVEELKNYLAQNADERTVIQAEIVIEDVMGEEDGHGIRIQAGAGTPEAGGSGTAVQP